MQRHTHAHILGLSTRRWSNNW